jgi:Right handed beta helix region
MKMHPLNFGAPTRAGVVFLWLGYLGATLWGSPSPNIQFTVEIMSPNLASRTLIETNASWRYFKGTSNPNAGWDTADDIFLGPAWGTNPAGFGYGGGDDRTLLTDMRNGYSTLYLRTTFTHEQVLDPGRLKLRIDYDDGFIAYLDGKEFARVNAPGEPDQRLPYNSLATASHEASRGPGGNPVETWYFGLDFPALFPHASEGGSLVRHVLAIQGLNRALDDDNFTLIPSLYLEKFFTEVNTDAVSLAGRINLAGAATVLVNGETATLDSTAGTWTKTHPLRPGLNRLNMEARDCDGNILATLTKDVLAKGTPRLANGTLTANTSWDSAAGIVELTGGVNVAAGVTLTIAEGTTVLFHPGSSLITSGGTIRVNGATNHPVYFLPADGETPWDGFTVSGAGSSLTLRFAEVVAGKIRLSDGANALLEDTTVRDFSYTAAGFEDYIAYALGNCLLTARRSVFSRYYTMAFGGRTTLHIDDCLFESSEHDFFKPQDTPEDSYVRRCTFAHSSVAGTDGVDTGANAAFTVDNCLFFDIPDKAISIEASTMMVTNCLIYGAVTGVAVKDDSTAILINNTIAYSTYGIAVYLKNAGADFAHASVTNNIVWGNNTNITLRNPDGGASSPNTTITVRSSDVGGGYPGAGNISSDPRFLDAAGGDFRLAAGSPAVGTGSGGATMGTPFPVGVSQEPVILRQPLSQTAGLGSDVLLRVLAMGSPPVLYQWRINDVDIPGATSASLLLSAFSAAREGQYRVRVASGGGLAITAPALVSLNEPLRMGYVAAARGAPWRIFGSAGQNFVLQTSSDLIHWIPVATNAAPTGIVEFHTARPPNNIPIQFYRAAASP